MGYDEFKRVLTRAALPFSDWSSPFLTPFSNRSQARPNSLKPRDAIDDVGVRMIIAPIIT